MSNPFLLTSSSTKKKELADGDVVHLNRAFDESECGGGCPGASGASGEFLCNPPNKYHYATNISQCVTSEGVTFINDTPDISFNIDFSGDVDDDVLVDGEALPDGQYNFFCEPPYHPVCGEGRCSGAHSFTYSGILGPNSQIKIQAQDNGFGGYINCEITLSNGS